MGKVSRGTRFSSVVLYGLIIDRRQVKLFPHTTSTAYFVLILLRSSIREAQR